jgi:NAD(P)-dependent dehydrogenase (short-subunit alcohol dehydrogenase family)
MDIALNGRSAVITGGSKGLGLAMALRFAKAGGDVAILARGREGLDAAEAELKKVSKGKVAAIACDVSKADEVDRAYKGVMSALGKIDIVVNNAGTASIGQFPELSDEVWHTDLDIKLFAAIRLTRLAWPQMKERHWGRVINVLNFAAKAPRAGTAPTSVSRAAGLALTKVMAGEGAPHNVLVNALMPGQFVTDQWVQRHKKRPGNQTFAEYTAEIGKNIPMGRMGDADEFARVALFLASDGANYVTGTAINVDGGLAPVI